MIIHTLLCTILKQLFPTLRSLRTTEAKKMEAAWITAWITDMQQGPLREIFIRGYQMSLVMISASQVKQHILHFQLFTEIYLKGTCFLLVCSLWTLNQNDRKKHFHTKPVLAYSEKGDWIFLLRETSSKIKLAKILMHSAEPIFSHIVAISHKNIKKKSIVLHRPRLENAKYHKKFFEGKGAFWVQINSFQICSQEF